MDLFDMRKKKDSKIVDDFEREIDHDSTEGNIPDNGNGKYGTIEENISDYIDPDDLIYDNYRYIIDTIENNGWTCVSSVANPITIFDTQMVFPKPIKANSYDTILEIVCPPERIITICGVNDSDIDLDDFRNSPNFYEIPHFFTLRCTDNNNVEISPTTIISILKNTRDEKLEKYYQEFYGDLSPIADGKLKKKAERYYFTDTIVLQSGERMIFRAHNPNIDISKIDILMMSDMFEKDEELEDHEEYEEQEE